MPVSTRDLLILLLTFLTLLLTLTQHGDISLERVSSVEMEVGGRSYKNGVGPVEREKVPHPIITDLDGDNTNEIVLITRTPTLQILRLKTPTASNDALTGEWEHLDVISETSLLQNLVLKSGRQAIAMATGYIHPYSDTTNRQQIIVVVTEGWNILVYNSALTLLWTHNVETDLSMSYLAEVSIMILPEKMHTGDTGSVIIGGRLAHLKDLSAYHGHVESDDEYGEEFRSDDEEHPDGHIHDESNAEDLELEDEHTETLLKDHRIFDRASHFSYYAFEGLTGALRWKHESGDFVVESEAADILRPQHDAHGGQVDWRVYRESIVKSLPHAWFTREDTHFDLQHFERHRAGSPRQATKTQLTSSSSSLFMPDLQYALRPHDDKEHIQLPNAIVAHLKDGLEILHLYSGRPLCRIGLPTRQVHVDVNGDGVVDHIQAVAGHFQAGGTLATGKEEISRATRHMGLEDTEEHKNTPKCLALVTSGIPSGRALFNLSLCQNHWTNVMRFNSLHLDGMMLDRKIGTSEEEQSISVAHPLVIPENSGPKLLAAGSLGGVTSSSSATRYHTYFLINSGLVTGVNHDGSEVWRVQTKAAWSTEANDAEGGESVEAKRNALLAHSFLPTLTPYTFTHDASVSHLLAVGSNSLSLLSVDGAVLADASLGGLDVSVHEPVLGDVNGDGINDVIITTANRYLIFAVHRRVSTALYTILLGMLVVLLLMVLAFKMSQQSTLVVGKKALRKMNLETRMGLKSYKSQA